MVRLTTMSMSGVASSSSTEQARGIPCVSAAALARPMSMSAQATTSRFANFLPAGRYALLMLPQPMTPILVRAAIDVLSAAGPEQAALDDGPCLANVEIAGDVTEARAEQLAL